MLLRIYPLRNLSNRWFSHLLETSLGDLQYSLAWSPTMYQSLQRAYLQSVLISGVLLVWQIPVLKFFVAFRSVLGDNFLDSKAVEIVMANFLLLFGLCFLAGHYVRVDCFGQYCLADHFGHHCLVDLDLQLLHAYFLTR